MTKHEIRFKLEWIRTVTALLVLALQIIILTKILG